MPTPTVPTPSVPDADTRVLPRSSTAAMTAARKALATGAMSDAIWVPLVSAILILAVGAMSLAMKRPWLFAALGPSAVLLAANPGHPTTRFHAIVLGHLTGLASAWLSLLLLGAADSNTVLAAGGLSVSRVWASALAVALTALIQPSLRAYHPPAAATVLLVTLGVHKLSWNTAIAMAGGVLVVALLGEWFQRIRMAEQRKARG